MAKGNNTSKSTVEIAAIPGYFGHVIKPGQTLVWLNEVEEFALQLNTAALGSNVAVGRSTLSVEAKENKIALCTLNPQVNEQWNLTQTFTAMDGPIVFHNEGVNEIHLTGFIDVQDEEDDDDCMEHDHNHGLEDGQYSDSEDDSDDDGVIVFNEDDEEEESESDEDEEGEEEGASDRFEVIDERVHGDVSEKKKNNTPVKDQAPAKSPAKSTPAKEVKTKTPIKEESKPKTPSKEENKPKTPSKEENKSKTPSKEESKPKTPLKEDNKPKTPSKEVAKSKTPEPKSVDSKKKTMAEKVAAATADSNSQQKKRAASSDSVPVPKKAKTSRVYKGVTIEEHAVGKGQPVQKGKKVSIIYRGKLESGEQFDAQQNRKKPFTFRHGIGDVIKGMDIGIEGMRSGSRRTITIPSHLGYGRNGAPPKIPGNATLVFDIELL